MRNPDTKKHIEAKEIMNKAIENGNMEEFNKGLDMFAEDIMLNVERDFKATEDVAINELIADKKYHLRKLSTAEENFYKEVVVSGNTFTNTPLPVSIFERVFEDLKAEHPLLSRIQFVNTTGVTEWVMRDGAIAAAVWGKICDPIEKQLDQAFIKKTLNNNKLSAFVNVCKSMLAVGPVWLDRFVREVLSESIALGLENAIVAGTGADQPIGMTKDLAGAVVSGVYPDKTTTALADFTAETIGSVVIAPMTVNGTRIVKPDDILFIVNPLDYWSKLFGKLAKQLEDGSYIMDKTAIGATIVQSVAVPSGKLVSGLAKDYFFGLALAENITYSDDYRFLEDDRVFVAKLLGNGQPINNTAFQVFDISGIA